MTHKFQFWEWAFLLIPQEGERMVELQEKALEFHYYHH
jgi:hypothetical protein